MHKALPVLRPPAALLLATFLLVTLAYQFQSPYTVDVGDFYDRAHVLVRGFHDRETTPDGVNFRWSKAESTVLFPGVGARDYWLSLRLHGWRPEGRPAPEMRVSVNGHYLGRATVSAGWQEYRFYVPAQALAGGTALVRLETEPFVPAGDPRSLGLAVREVALLPLYGAGKPLSWPAWDQVGLALLTIALLYFSFRVLGLPPRWAALAALPAPLLLAWGLAFRRLGLTIYTSRLAIVAGLGLALVLLLRWLLPRFLAWGRIEAAGWEKRLLLTIFLLSFLLKAGGMLHPYSIAWDLKLQLNWSSWIWDGRLAELYGVNSPLHERTMPAEWGQEKPLIPYSPFYHLTAASFFLLPWRPYDTANVFNVLLDVTKPLMLYLIARRLGLNGRVGLFAASLLALFPATFLLLAWGNAPTMVGLWWQLAAACYLVGAWERLHRPGTWAGLVFFLLGALLYYTALGAFLVIAMLILLLGLARHGRRLQPNRTLAVLLAFLAAVGLALLIYYGQFIGPILERTIPRLLASAQQGGANLGTVPVPWSQYLRDNLDRLSWLSYGLLLPILLAVGSLGTGWRHAEVDIAARPLRRCLLVAWFGTAFLFFLVGFRVDMVDKEIWYAMPAIALVAAVTLDGLWRRRPAGQVTVAIVYLFLATAALLSWLTRLATVRQLDWVNADAPVVGEVIRAVAAIWGRGG